MEKSVFKRKIYNEILEWKENRSDKYALLIKGARRIGKSTIAKEFAEKEFKSYILIDFAHTSKEIIELFDDMYNLDFFFLQLQQFTGVRLYENESVIIFDEVQLLPKARQTIKYLVADGRYKYIETGSLLSIKKNTKDILIPSEEHKISMYPMDFEEFLWAIDDTMTADTIKLLMKSKKPAGNALHRNLMRTFRLYMLIGGMPQAIESYLESNNLQVVDEVKREIIDLYEEDFIKIDGTGLAGDIYDAIPANLSSNASRYILSTAKKGIRSNRVRELIPDMLSSFTVNIAYHANKYLHFRLNCCVWVKFLNPLAQIIEAFLCKWCECIEVLAIKILSKDNVVHPYAVIVVLTHAITQNPKIAQVHPVCRFVLDSAK